MGALASALFLSYFGQLFSSASLELLKISPFRSSHTKKSNWNYMKWKTCDLLHDAIISWNGQKYLAKLNNADFLVDRDALIVQWWCLENDSTCASNAGQCEDPQEESVQHHWHVLPVLNHLSNAQTSISPVTQYRKHAFKEHLHSTQ